MQSAQDEGSGAPIPSTHVSRDEKDNFVFLVSANVVCDQGVPSCSACRRRGAGECIYIPGNDGRRRDPVERLRRDNDMMKTVLQAIKSSSAEDAHAIVESIRSDYTLEDLVSLIQSRGTEFSEASPSSFGSASNSASAELESPPGRTARLHSPDSKTHNHQRERKHLAGEPDLELPPIANHHRDYHHYGQHRDPRKYPPASSGKLPVFEATSGRNLRTDEYRHFPPTL
ncbi:hypothetical protein ABW21_db0205561 [Orbilia brochopaga]|nr:hypothetical protein ABW21_db0205561 [Drechslerella brochopaga]